MTTHVKVIAIAFWLIGAFTLVGAFFSSLLFSALAGLVGSTGEEGAGVGVAVLGLTGLALMVMLVLFAIPSLICGWGLWNFRGWSRLLAIILAAICLLNVPLGTIFGIYVLIIMFRKDTEALFVA
jgi:hypothetical protein